MTPTTTMTTTTTTTTRTRTRRWTSSDGGRSWQPRSAPDDAAPVLGFAAFVDWRAGTIDVVLGTATGDVLRQLDGARPLATPATAAIADGDLDQACRRGGVSWWMADGAVYRAAAGAITARPITLADDDARIADCTVDAALVEQATTPVGYHRCTAQGCAQAFRGGSYAFGRATMLDDGALVYVAGRGHVLAVWRDGATDPAYLALPRPLTLHALVSWDGAAHALLYDRRDPDRHLLAVPLPPR